MMPFIVYFPNHLLGEPDMHTGIRALADFYRDLTPKHRKRIRILAGDACLSAHLPEELQAILLNEKWQLARSGQDSTPSAGIVFYPAVCDRRSFIIETLSAGLPFIGYDKGSSRALIDHSCGILVHASQEDPVQTFSHQLKMLYFDPGAWRMLKKGALRRYHFLNKPAHKHWVQRASFA